MISAFIFDFDGVIADTESLWAETLLGFSKQYGLDITYETLESVVGDGDASIIKLLIHLLGYERDYHSVYEELKADFRKRTEKLKPRDGLLSYFDYAYQNGIMLACASNSSRTYVEDWLTKLNLLRWFHCIVTRTDVGADGMKPKPDIYQETLARLSISPNNALAFEDSITGVMAAETAGIRCILVPNSVTERKTSKLPNHRLYMDLESPETLMLNLKYS